MTNELPAQVESLADENDRLSQRLEGVRELRVKTLEALVESEQERARLLERIIDSEQERARLLETTYDSQRQYEDTIRRLTAELDAARSDVQALQSELARVAGQLTAERDAARSDVQALQSELARVEGHRQELISAVNAICTSESWRIGHALTWPARAIRRLGRRKKTPIGSE